MSMTKKIVITFFFVTILFQISKGSEYEVGDDAGWKIGVDYKSWSSSKSFNVGDVIVFDYNTQFHNVIRVSHKNFRSCNATAPFAIFHTGHDSFVIKNPGHYYFICGFGNHCQQGQKVDIRVVGAQPPPYEPTPSPSQPAPYLPAPAPAPASAHSGSSRYSYSVGLAIMVLASAFIGIWF